jgi:gliding motility-associated-like protein
LNIRKENCIFATLFTHNVYSLMSFVHKILFPFLLLACPFQQNALFSNTIITNTDSIALAAPNSQVIVDNMVGKVTFRVDTRGISVNPAGMFLAADFFFTIGLSNWTFQPMCNLGSGIWEVSFANVPPGMFQYKFLNGPGNWEFPSSGGPCTNPADNDNRFVTVTGGVQMVGPFCFNVCSLFCSGFSDPGVSDVTPPDITQNIPATLNVDCQFGAPAATALTADDGCDINATTTTGLPTESIQTVGACGTKIITRTWTVTDCAGNTSAKTQVITLSDTSPPTITGVAPANISATCGNLPTPLPLTANDFCDLAVTTTGLPTDVLMSSGGCGSLTIKRTWKATDCNGNTATKVQMISVTDNSGPTITGVVPANLTVTCGNIPPFSAITATDACDPLVTMTALPTDNLAGLSACGVGTIIRTWKATDCSGNTSTKTQTITVNDNTPPVLTVPANVTVICTAIPNASTTSATATDNCIGPAPTISFQGDVNVGSGCPYQIQRTWKATDCAGNTSLKTQTITVNDNVAPTFTSVPPDITVCDVPPLPTLAWTDNCGPGGMSMSLETVFSATPLILQRKWEATDQCGNTKTAIQLITVSGLTANAGPNQVINCSNPTVTLGTSNPSSGFTYQWAGPGINASNINLITPEVALSGTYTVTLTNTSTSCTGTASVNVTQNSTLPTANAGADQSLTCATTSVTLNGSGSAGSTFLWQGAGINVSNETLPNPMVTQAGMYILTTTNPINGCMKKDTAIVALNGNLPVSNAGLDQIITCNVSSVTLNGSGSASGAGITYQWIAPNGSNLGTALTQTATAAGTYKLVVANSITGCSSTATVDVLNQITPPIANAGADASINCSNPTVTLGGSSSTGAGIQYSWTLGGISQGTNATLTTSVTGNYTLTVSNITTGCSATDAVSVMGASTMPIADAGIDLQIGCGAATVMLDASASSAAANITYTWTGPGTFTSNLQNPTVGAAGTYSLVVTNTQSGCSATDQVAVTASTGFPVADAGANQAIDCNAASVTLDGSNSATGANIAYQWIAANGTNLGTAITQNATAIGVYQFIVTNITSGCSASSNVTVTNTISLPLVNAGADATITCSNAVATIGGTSAIGSNIQYSWTLNGISQGSNATLMTSIPGIYTLIVSNTTNSCSASDMVTVTGDANLPVANAGADQQIGCGSTSVTLNANSSSSGPNITYAWTNGASFSSNLQNPSVGTAGIYTLTVSNSLSGCSATDQVEVTASSGFPIADAGANQIINCNAASVTLNGANSATGANIAYQWVAPNGTNLGTAITQNATIIGIYQLIVTNTSSNCSATATVEVTANSQLPVANGGQDMIINCTNPSVTLLGGSLLPLSNYAFSWTNTATSAVLSNTLQLSVNTAGSYTFNVKNLTSGCIGTDVVLVTSNLTQPTANAGNDVQLSCSNPTINLNGSGTGTGALSYAWTGTNFMANVSNPQVGAAGTYTLVVTDQNNGCTKSDVVIVTADAGFPVADAGIGGKITCETTQIILSAENSTQGSNISLKWKNAAGTLLGSAVTLAVTTVGVYTLSVLNTTTGCESFATVTVTLDTIKPIAKAGLDQSFTCTQTVLTLNGGNSTPANGISYEWTGAGILTNSDQSSIDINEAGDYILTVTQISNGCTNTDIVTISENTIAPTGNAGADQTITCTTTNVTLTGSTSATSATFLWTGPDINSINQNLTSPMVSSAGIYTLVATDLATGCKSQIDYVEVIDNQIAPSVIISASAVLDCQNQSATLTSSTNISPADASYQWSFNNQSLTNATNSIYLAQNAGQYSLELTDNNNGCSQLGVFLLEDLSTNLPINITGAALLNCINTELQLVETSVSNMPNINLTWSTIGGNIIQPTLSQSTIRLDAQGLYILTAEDTSNGCKDRDSIVIAADFDRPILSFDQTFAIGCATPETQLEVIINSSSNNFSYNWSGNNFTSSEVMPSVAIAGTYQVTVTQESNGCTSTANTEVIQTDGIQDLLFTTQSPDCQVIETGILTIDTVIGGSKPYEFSLNGGVSSTNLVFSTLDAGDYSLLVTDAAGCTAERTFTIDPKPEFLLNLTPEQTIELGDSVQLKPLASTIVSTYNWSDSLTLSCKTCAEPWAKPYNTHSYTLLATNADGCTMSASVKVIVIRDLKIFAPNAFAPEGTGGNQKYMVFTGSQISMILDFKIFDRWGELLYNKENFPPNSLNDGWDGYYRDKKMNSGIYGFYANLKLVDGTTEEVKGGFLLVR